MAEKRSVNFLFLFRKDDKFYWMDITKIGNEGQELPPLSDNDDVVTLNGTVEKSARPGQIFAFEYDGEKVFFSKKGGNKYLGMWDNESDLQKLRARHDAFEADRQAKESMQKEGAKKYHLEVLANLRSVYRDLPSPVRAQLLAKIVHYMTS
jgi:hypothetical protein